MRKEGCALVNNIWSIFFMKNSFNPKKFNEKQQQQLRPGCRGDFIIFDNKTNKLNKKVNKNLFYYPLTVKCCG